MQMIDSQPKILLEAAHNPSGMIRVIPEIIDVLPRRWSLLFGTSPQRHMDEFLRPLQALIQIHPPVEIITTEPQKGIYP